MRYLTLGLCLFAAACGAESPTAPTRVSELTVRGTLEATETVEGALHRLTGTGDATNLGRFTLTAEFTVTSPPPAASGTARWVAANADKILTTTTGQMTLTPPTASIIETHVITGGTGRFSGVSGRLVLERVLNLQTLASSGSISGTVNVRE
jgi:hypothetical protein